MGNLDQSHLPGKLPLPGPLMRWIATGIGSLLQLESRDRVFGIPRTLPPLAYIPRSTPARSTLLVRAIAEIGW